MPSSTAWSSYAVNPARVTRLAVVLAAGSVGVALWLSAIDDWLRLTGWALAACCLIATLRCLGRQHGMLRLSDDAQVRWREESFRLLGSPVVLSWWIRLGLREDRTQRRVVLWLTPDMLGATAHRALRRQLLTTLSTDHGERAGG